jgi:DNA-directed RNA polymerase specialized sigma24 family protein
MNHPANISNDSVRQAYVTALLLTGDPADAESAVADALRAAGHVSGDQAGDKEGWFAERVQHEAIGRQRPGRSSRPDALRGDDLPPELLRVMSLPARLRSCFVLRILAGATRDACARLLNLRVQEVDCYTREALANLPGLGLSQAA